MDIKIFDKQSDYDLVCSWWKEHGWATVPKESLPSTGVLVNNIVAGWLYKTDSDMAWVEWIISDRKSDKKERKECTKVLIHCLVELGKSEGYTKFFTSTFHPSLTQSYLDSGFIKTDSNVSHFILRVS